MWPVQPSESERRRSTRIIECFVERVPHLVVSITEQLDQFHRPKDPAHLLHPNT